MDWVVDNRWWVDALRVIIVVMGVCLAAYVALLMLHWRRLDMDLARKLRYLSLGLFAFYTVIQQAMVLGEPLVVWRLLLLFLCTLTGIVGMMLPDIHSFWRTRHLDPIHRFDWPDAHDDRSN